MKIKCLFLILIVPLLCACNGNSNSNSNNSTNQAEELQPKIVKPEQTYQQSQSDYNQSNSSSYYYEENDEPQYQHYKESSSNDDGRVVYKGDDGYYIINLGHYFKVARNSFNELSVGDNIRGNLDTFGWEYVLVNSEDEVEIQLESSRFSSSDDVTDWMGENEHLAYNDQKKYNNDKNPYSRFSNYKETSSCCNGVVVYEGSSDYFIVETNQGYTVLETSSGYFSKGDQVRGELNSYNFKYLIKNEDTEVSVYIKAYMLSKNRAIEWLGEHRHLKYSDQQTYESYND